MSTPSAQRLPHRFGEFKGDVSFLGYVDPVRFDISDRLNFTEGRTLGVPITKVTLDCHPLHRIKQRGSKGACNDARLTPNAFILIDHHSLVFHLRMTRLRRTHLHTEGLLAVLTGRRKIEPYVLPFDHLDPGPAGIARSSMKDGTDQLTLPTPRTFFLIQDQHFPVHRYLLCFRAKNPKHPSKFKTDFEKVRHVRAHKSPTESHFSFSSDELSSFISCFPWNSRLPKAFFIVNITNILNFIISFNFVKYSLEIVKIFLTGVKNQV